MVQLLSEMLLADKVTSKRQERKVILEQNKHMAHQYFRKLS